MSALKSSYTSRPNNIIETRTINTPKYENPMWFYSFSEYDHHRGLDY